MFNIHEAVWWVVAEIEDWLYPYYDRLTPEEKFEIRVKDSETGEEYYVEQHIQSLNQRIEKLQDEMVWARDRIHYLEDKVKTKIKVNTESSSVSGKVKGTFD